MAFGITKEALRRWKESIDRGEIAFLTHYWLDDRFPDAKSVTKVGCNDLHKLQEWGTLHGLKKEWIHYRKDGYSHYDLLGPTQRKILETEGMVNSNKKFL